MTVTMEELPEYLDKLNHAIQLKIVPFSVEFSSSTCDALNSLRYLSTSYKDPMWNIYTHLIALQLCEVSIEGSLDLGGGY